MFKQGKPLLRAATANLELSKALFAAAEKTNSPLFIQITESTIDYAGIENIYGIVQELEKRSSIPVCVHLDHGRHPSVIKKVISIGFKSVMIDASHLPLEKNIASVKKVVSIARKKGCSVEAEIGALKRIGSEGQALTDPEEARHFVKETGCDYLAVAIGTSHGAHKFTGRANLDFERLKEIRDLVSVPLVLHGASSVPKEWVQKCNKFGAKIAKAKGVPEESLKKAIKLGVAKINIDTDLRLAFTAGLRETHRKRPENFDPRKAMLLSQQYVQEVAERKIKLFGSKGKA